MNNLLPNPSPQMPHSELMLTHKAVPSRNTSQPTGDRMTANSWTLILKSFA